MVKLDVTCMRHLSKSDYRVLTAVEMGMKNHDLVPTELIASIAKLRTGGAHRIINTLHAFKLIAHDRSTYDGYRLTFLGYDVLALHVLCVRGHIASMGNKVGCGKESDIYMAQTSEGVDVILKLHRLGRTCFRAVKQKRDYLLERSSASWLYMSRLSALKEYAFMKALHEHGFPTPTPIDQNRHVVLMSVAKGYPMYQVRGSQGLKHPEIVYKKCMELIVRLAQHGLIHCDFNEFNLLLHKPEGADVEDVTLIDFPQMVSTRHKNGEEMFDRDVGCIVKFFTMKLKWDPPEDMIPSFASAQSGDLGRLDDSVRASGFTEEQDEMLLEFIEEEGDGTEEETEDPEEEEPENSENVPTQSLRSDSIEVEGEVENDLTITELDNEAENLENSENIPAENDETNELSDEEGNDDVCDTNSVAESQREKDVKYVDAKVRQKALQQARKAHGGGGAKPSRNVQKQRFRGKILRKGQDF